MNSWGSLGSSHFSVSWRRMLIKDCAAGTNARQETDGREPAKRSVRVKAANKESWVGALFKTV